MTTNSDVEWLEVVGSDCRTLGVYDFDTLHELGLLHKVVHVWLIDDDERLLVQKRAHACLNWPDLWHISVAGHHRAGETLLDAAARETEEEVRVRLPQTEFLPLGVFRFDTWIFNRDQWDRAFIFPFLARSTDANIATGPTLEVARTEWVSLAAFRERVADPHGPWIPQLDYYLYVLQALGRLGLGKCGGGRC